MAAVLEMELPVSAREVEQLPRLTLSPEEAAAALGVSRDFFDKHVKPEIRVVTRGARGRGRRLVLVPVRELERWIEANAARLFE